ncbi:hypothetical protein [Actinomadura kijaniata]|uniref:hypothetical protein n=1 Tax=Actinomadura kijaniata TaxID=46161 RepID=UPI00082A3109|nr:hypothetical protein [Actinomadura kijaniata]
MTQADPDVEAYVLWWKKTTQVGRVAREWSRRHDRAVWQAQHTPAEGKQRSRQRLVFAGYKNDGFASRAAALRALAAEAVHRRRQATIHRDEPIEGLPAGWRLVQSQAEADEGRWRVVAPGGQVAGTLRRTTYGGRREWQARSGDPDSDRIGVELPPMPTSSYRGVDEQAWRTRMPAARAIAAYHDLDLDTPDLDV